MVQPSAISTSLCPNSFVIPSAKSSTSFWLGDSFNGFMNQPTPFALFNSKLSEFGLFLEKKEFCLILFEVGVKLAVNDKTNNKPKFKKSSSSSSSSSSAHSSTYSNPFILDLSVERQAMFGIKLQQMKSHDLTTSHFIVGNIPIIKINDRRYISDLENLISIRLMKNIILFSDRMKLIDDFRCMIIGSILENDSIRASFISNANEAPLHQFINVPKRICGIGGHVITIHFISSESAAAFAGAIKAVSFLLPASGFSPQYSSSVHIGMLELAGKNSHPKLSESVCCAVSSSSPKFFAIHSQSTESNDSRPSRNNTATLTVLVLYCLPETVGQLLSVCGHCRVDGKLSLNGTTAFNFGRVAWTVAGVNFPFKSLTEDILFLRTWGCDAAYCSNSVSALDAYIALAMCTNFDCNAVISVTKEASGASSGRLGFLRYLLIGQQSTVLTNGRLFGKLTGHDTGIQRYHQVAQANLAHALTALGNKAVVHDFNLSSVFDTLKINPFAKMDCNNKTISIISGVGSVGDGGDGTSLNDAGGDDDKGLGCAPSTLTANSSTAIISLSQHLSQL